MDTLKVNLDFNTLRGNFFRALQHQQDIARLLISGARSVSEKLVQESIGFQHFDIAAGAHLSHLETQQKAEEWLQRSFLSDSIEVTGLFLDECLTVCEILRLSSKGKVPMLEIKETFEKKPLDHQKIHFPEKINTLKKKYGIQPRHTEAVLSLNKIRACLTHRLGLVGKHDLGKNDALIGLWISTKIVLKGLDTGIEITLTEPQTQGLDEESQVQMHVVEHKRHFNLGEKISLTDYEMFSTIYTLFNFGASCVECIENYTKSLGIKIAEPSTAPQ